MSKRLWMQRLLLCRIAQMTRRVKESRCLSENCKRQGESFSKIQVIINSNSKSSLMILRCKLSKWRGTTTRSSDVSTRSQIIPEMWHHSNIIISSYMETFKKRDYRKNTIIIRFCGMEIHLMMTENRDFRKILFLMGRFRNDENLL